MFDHYGQYMERQITRMIYQLPRRRAPSIDTEDAFGVGPLADAIEGLKL